MTEFNILHKPNIKLTSEEILTILLIEDNESLNKLFSRLLSRKGYKVEVAYNLSAAKKSLKASEFDVIISDLHLPDGKGSEILKLSTTFQSSAPFRILTSSDDNWRAYCEESDYDFFMAKPFSLEESLNILHQYRNR